MNEVVEQIRRSVKVLGVPATASGEEIEVAFRKKAMMLHPDRGGNAEDFNQLMAAYEFIKDLKECAVCKGTGECAVGITPFMIILKCGYCHGVGKIYEK